MKEISLHILDLVQNSIHAEARLISISILEDKQKNLFQLEIEDDGNGMDKEILAQINDPFFTTGNKKTGLGIPLLKQHCEASGGDCIITSKPGKGTKVHAGFKHDHIDRQPLGDIVATLVSIIRSNPDRDFLYRHHCNGKHFSFDTREVKKELDNIPINNSDIIAFISEMISENIQEIIA